MSGQKIIQGLNEATAFLGGDTTQGRFARLSPDRKAILPPNFSAPLIPRFVKLRVIEGGNPEGDGGTVF